VKDSKNASKIVSDTGKIVLLTAARISELVVPPLVSRLSIPSRLQEFAEQTVKLLCCPAPIDEGSYAKDVSPGAFHSIFVKDFF
jgi:hypothetical protein